MATCWDVWAAMAHVRDCTADVTGGLTADEVARINPGMEPELADALLAKIRAANPTLFDPTGAPIGGPEPQRGEAVQAVEAVEAQLSGVHTDVADIDRQLIAAILHAHKTTAEGRADLDRLEKDIEGAAKAHRLDTALGAREFQTYLIGKLKEILAVVGDANDSDESKRELVAALTALYAAQGAPADPGPQPKPAETTPTPAPEARPDAAPDAVPAATGDVGADPYLDALPLDAGPGAPAGAPPEPTSNPSAGATPMMPGIPSFGGLPSTGSGLMSGESPLAGLLHGLAGEHDEPPFEDPTESEDPTDADAADTGDPADADAAADASADQQTTVTLPDGHTITAPSPLLARVIQAVADGTAIPDAFRAQGITIPAPGTAVAAPLDPAQVGAGDIGMFTDRHALAVGDGRALLDGQIQHITNVSGPSFLGWQHPPGIAPAPPTTTELPTPTLPSARAASSR